LGAADLKKLMPKQKADARTRQASAARQPEKAAVYAEAETAAPSFQIKG